jgi:hypothetical protein
MMVFSCVDAECLVSVFLPNKRISLSFVHSRDLDKHFLCMKTIDKNSKPLTSSFIRRYYLIPFLSNYKALPYKRESSISEYRRFYYRLTTHDFGFPWFNKHESLDKIRGFYSNYKKYYVTIAHRSISPDEDDEKVPFVCGSYSDAISLSREYSYEEGGEISRLLGKDFKPYNWYPYLWIESMNHPISLFSQVSSYTGSYSLGPEWCRYLLCFLRDGFVPCDSVYFDSVFCFVQKDKFRQVIHWR